MVVQKFLDRRYEEEVLNEHFNKVDRIEWKELFTKKKEKSHRIPLLITYNETLLNISRIVNRHRNILQVNTGFREVFQVKPVIAFKRIENTPEIIGSHTIKQRFLRKVLMNKPENLCPVVWQEHHYALYK